MRLLISMALLAGAAMPALASARSLAGGGGPEISMIRVGAALVLCLAAAFAAAIVLRRMNLPQGWRGFAVRPSRARRIEVIETRRLATHAELSLVRCGDAEFLILCGQSDAKVISRGAADDRPCGDDRA